MEKKNIKKKIWNIENDFIQLSETSRLKKYIYQYELFKKTAFLEGDFVECGVFKGNSFIRFLTYNALFKKNKKFFYGFDAFGKFPETKLKSDKIFIKKWNKDTGTYADKKILGKILKKKKFQNYKLIKGDIFKTLHPILDKQIKKISFLHLDMDTFDATYYALNQCYKKLQKKGIVLIDDYGTVDGATIATDKFIKKNNLKIHKIDKLFKPVYLIK